MATDSNTNERLSRIGISIVARQLVRKKSGYITAVGHNIQPLLDNFEAAELI